MSIFQHHGSYGIGGTFPQRFQESTFIENSWNHPMDSFSDMTMPATSWKEVTFWSWCTRPGKLTVRPWQIGVGRLVSIKNWLFSGSMFIYQRVMSTRNNLFRIYRLLASHDTLCLGNVYVNFGNQTWFAGKSSVLFDHFPRIWLADSCAFRKISKGNEEFPRFHVIKVGHVF